MAVRRSFRRVLPGLLSAFVAAGCTRGEQTEPVTPPVQEKSLAPATAPAAPPAVTETSARREAQPAVAAHADAAAALPLFARPVSGGWRFPSPYHYHEWRLAAGLRRSRPTEVRLRDGTTAALTVAHPAVPGVAILIDDLGNSSAALRALSALPFPVNGAVLPHAPLVMKSSRAVRSNGGDVFLHLPLEPIGYPKDDPGPGALWVTMPAEARKAAFAAAWNSVPERVGLNNHMGSRYTSDIDSMAALAADVSARDALFVDSRTVPRSHAHTQMAARGVRSLGRTHFLDDKPGEAEAETQLRDAIAYAKRHGYALAIGHPNTATIKVLKRAAPLFEEAGVRAITLRELFQPSE